MLSRSFTERLEKQTDGSGKDHKSLTSGGGERAGRQIDVIDCDSDQGAECGMGEGIIAGSNFQSLESGGTKKNWSLQ
jgi:hypothetical protein